MSCLPNKSHTTLRCQTIPSFPSWLRDEGRSLHLMMGREFLLHLYLESPVFFQIQPGNLEQLWGLINVLLLVPAHWGPPAMFSCYLFSYLLMFLRDESRAYLLPHFILGSLQGNWQPILGRDRRSLPLLTCHSE